MKRHPVRTRLCALFILPLLLLPARAAVIFAETGRHAYGWQARYDEFGIASWSQTNIYYDVTITAPLYSVATDDVGVAYLTRRIGPGATTADEVARAPIAFPRAPSHPTDAVIFSGLTLGPGTYYLMITGGTNYWSSWYGTDQPTRIMDDGVAYVADVYVYNPPAAYPPASPFQDHPWMRHIFAVTGYREGENRPPVANAGPDQNVGCTSQPTITLDGRASTDPNGDPLTYTWSEGAQVLGSGATLGVALPAGSHTIRLVVTDSAGLYSSDFVVVNIGDTAPPQLQASASPAVLWPANGKMIPVQIRARVTDNCDSSASARIVSVESDDPTARPSDWEITGDLTLKLRARRHGKQPRNYFVHVEAMDSSGNTTQATVSVAVSQKSR